VHNSEAEVDPAQFDCVFLHGEATNSEHDLGAGQTKPQENAVMCAYLVPHSSS
jgi:hypothetical protein